jgi:16S rRNA A1518/A1519 N6-dimethyltransferase RsmA/KsgA/DIM1 with predicted DNA glycosylase/AP lyase activity
VAIFLIEVPEMRKIALVVALSGLFAVCSSMARAADKASPKPPRTPDCVYVGTPQDVVYRMIELAEIRKGDLVCDPGCGDGRLVIAAARRHDCRGIGYEIDPGLAKEARQIARQRGVAHAVRIEEQDIFTVDYSRVDVIVAYLLPNMITRLVPAFEKLKPGSRIVAHDYPMAKIVPERIVTMTSNEDNVEHTIYIYRTPLKPE